MGTCEVKRIKAVKLCLADLVHLVQIQTRDLEPSGYDSSQPVEVFTTIRTQWCAVETVGGGVSRFGKINILEDTTHIFWTMYDSSFPDLENRNHWILSQSIRFKVLKVDNINERDTALAIQTTERGDSSLEAAKA